MVTTFAYSFWINRSKQSTKPLTKCTSRKPESKGAQYNQWQVVAFKLLRISTWSLQNSRAEPSGQRRDEKFQAVVAQSIFPSQHAQKAPSSDRFWKLRCWESAHRCGMKNVSKSKCTKHTIPGAHFEVRRWFCVADARDSAPSQKWGKGDGFVACPKTSEDDGRPGTEEDLQRCISHGRRSTRDLFVRDVRESGCILEHRVFRFAKMILRDGCSTVCVTWPHFFRGRRSCLDRWIETITKRSGMSLAELLRFCVFNFENGGSLANLFCFWRCPIQRLRKSRRIASFLTLSTSKIEQVSQTSFEPSLQIDR